MPATMLSIGHELFSPIKGAKRGPFRLRMHEEIAAILLHRFDPSIAAPISVRLISFRASLPPLLFLLSSFSLSFYSKSDGCASKYSLSLSLVVERARQFLLITGSV